MVANSTNELPTTSGIADPVPSPTPEPRNPPSTSDSVSMVVNGTIKPAPPSALAENGMDESTTTSGIADPVPSPNQEPPKPLSMSDSASMVVHGTVKPAPPPSASVDPVSSPTPKERLHSLIERDIKLLDETPQRGFCIVR